MKAIRLSKPRDIACVELDRPTPKPGEVMLKIASAGICGSDLSSFRGTNKLVSYPRIIGHELAGTVVEIGPDTETDLKPGDRVIVNPYVYCGRCYPCSLGRTNCCTDLHVAGVHIDGGVCEYFCHPARMVIPIPDSIPWDIAPMAEPLVIALHGLHRGRLQAGEHAVIIGAGPIGFLTALAVKALGAAPILLDMVDSRLEYAARCGIEHVINPGKEDAVAAISSITGGRMAELVCECSGSNRAVQSALEYVSFAGRITLTGWPPVETPLPTDKFTFKELDVLGSRNAMSHEFCEAIDLIASGRVDVRKALTKTIVIDDVPEVIADIEANPGKYMKVNILL